MIEAQLEWDGVVLPLESPTWENVLSAARRLQGLEISEDFFLTYKDDEGDVINVKNAIDLAEAVRWAEEQKVACLCLRIPFSSSDSDDESWTEINDGLAQQQMDGSLSRQVTEETENGTIRRSPSPSAEEVILEHEPGSAKSPEIANEAREEPSVAIPREGVAAEVLSGEGEAEASSETESDSETEPTAQSIEQSFEKSEEPAPVVEQTPQVVLTPIDEVFVASSLLSEKEAASSLNPEKVIELLYRAAQGDLIQGKSPREFLLTLLSSSEALEALKQVINVPAVTAAITQVANSERLNKGVAQKAATTELIRLMYRDSEFLDVLNKVPDVDQLILYLFASLREATPNAPAEMSPSAATRVVKVVHRDVECDGCAVDSQLRSQSILEGFRNDSGEICGFRYKSAVLPNYDLCEVCERDGRFEEKAGPFLKIRDKTQVPEVILCIMPGATQEAMQRSASVDWHNPVAQEFFEFLRERHEPNPTNSPSDTPVSEQSAPPNLGEQASQPLPTPTVSSEESDDLRCKHMLTRFETPHGNFRCDMCSRKVPARTVLYGCRTCNFDLCTDCRSARSDVMGAVPTVNVASASPIAAAPLPVAPRSLPPQAKFVCDVTLADGSTVRQNERLIKVWRVRNAGSEAWPEGTRIAHVGGDPFGGPMEGVQVPLAAPGAIVDISVPLVMPSIPGRYTSYWRLMTPYPQSAKFGHRFWVTVNVVPGVPRPAPPPPMPAEPVVTLPVVDLRSSGLVGSPTVLNLNNVPPPPPMVEPGIPDEYVESVSKIVDFGFTDLEKIVQVLSSVNGNVAEAIERLLEEA